MLLPSAGLSHGFIAPPGTFPAFSLVLFRSATALAAAPLVGDAAQMFYLRQSPALIKAVSLLLASAGLFM